MAAVWQGRMEGFVSEINKFPKRLFWFWNFPGAAILNDRPFSKMAAENSNKLKLKINTGNRKSTFTLVTLQSFGIPSVISAEKM